jgi:3,8-divinyl chlorophyllide a/chlorophyllide a reductase subunit Y
MTVSNDSTQTSQQGKPCQLHPQTMCPAFGALRVLTRIEGAHPVMASDTGCLYGLKFVTHFYGARKSIIAAHLRTDELMAGEVVEGTRAAIELAAKEPDCELIPVISLCVAETAGLPEEMLPQKVGDAEVVLVRVPAYAIHSHPECKDVALSALVNKLGSKDAERQQKSLVLLGEVFPADPLAIDGLLRKMGVESTITLPGRSIGDLRRASSFRAVAPLHPFYKNTIAAFREFGLSVVGGAPVGISGTYAWLQAIGKLLELDPDLVQQTAEQERAQAEAMLNAQPLSGRILVTGYEGSELAYARLLVESGAEVPYVSTSIGADPMVLPDETWLRMNGTREVVYRKSLEDDVAALDEYKPDLVLGTTTFCAIAKERGIPAMYFTNQLASRPFFLSTGMAATLQFINQTLDRSDTYTWMQEFFMLEDADAT